MNDIRNQAEKLIISKTLIGGLLSPTTTHYFLLSSVFSLPTVSTKSMVASI